MVRGRCWLCSRPIVARSLLVIVTINVLKFSITPIYNPLLLFIFLLSTNVWIYIYVLNIIFNSTIFPRTSGNCRSACTPRGNTCILDIMCLCVYMLYLHMSLHCMRNECFPVVSFSLIIFAPHSFFFFSQVPGDLSQTSDDPSLSDFET